MRPQERVLLDLRRLGIPEIPLLGRYHYSQAHRGLDQHSHRAVLEICYLAKGHQLYRVGRQDYILKGGDLFLTFPNEMHSTGESPEEKGTLYWVQIQLPRPHQGFLNCRPTDAAHIVRELLQIRHRHFSGNPVIKDIFDNLIHDCQTPETPLRHVAIQNRLIALLLQVIVDSRREPYPRISEPVGHLLRYIETHHTQALPLAMLAARLQLSLPRFKTRFRQEVGIPPAEYVLRCKVAAAKRLLARPDGTVTNAAYSLGFSSSQYFATVFRRYTGQTPRQFHQQNAGSGKDSPSKTVLRT